MRHIVQCGYDVQKCNQRKGRNMRTLKYLSVLSLFLMLTVSACAGSDTGASNDPGRLVAASTYDNNLSSAVEKIGSTERVRLQVGTVATLSGNTAIPANISLIIADGGSINIDRYMLTINGAFSARPSKVFYGEGNVRFVPASIAEAIPEWWGAKGDGVTDDTAAINKAIAAFPTVKLANKKTYILGSVTRGTSYLENVMLKALNGMTLRGEGPDSVLKRKDHMMDQSDDQLNAHMIGGSNLSNITIENIRFEENGNKNLTPAGKIRNGMAVLILNGENVTIRNSWFYNSAGTNSVTLNGTGKGVLIEKNYWSVGGHGIPGNVNNTDFSFVYSEWTDTKILNNTIAQYPGNNRFSGGIEIHGSNSVAQGNKISYCEPGIWIASMPNSIENITVSGNTIENSHRGIAFWRGKTLRNVTINKNLITTKVIPAYAGGASYAISIPTPSNGIWDADHADGGAIEDITISNNTLSDNNGILNENNSLGILLTSLNRVRIVNNTLSNFNSIAIMLVGGPYGINDLNIEGNTIRNWGMSGDIYGKAAFHIDLSGSSTVPPVPRFTASNISIKNNNIAQDTARNSNIHAYFFTWPQGAMTNLTVGNNMINANVGTLFAGDQGIAFSTSQNP